MNVRTIVLFISLFSIPPDDGDDAPIIITIIITFRQPFNHQTNGHYDLNNDHHNDQLFSLLFVPVNRDYDRLVELLKWLINAQL